MPSVCICGRGWQRCCGARLLRRGIAFKQVLAYLEPVRLSRGPPKGASDSGVATSLNVGGFVSGVAAGRGLREMPAERRMYPTCRQWECRGRSDSHLRPLGGGCPALHRLRMHLCRQTFGWTIFPPTNDHV